MEDLSEKINSILSSPEALEQIKGLSEMLGIKEVHNTDKTEEVLPDDTLSLVTKIAPFVKNMNKDDDTIRLLRALRPFLSDERNKKIDSAEKILKILKFLPMLKDTGILESLF